MPSKHTPPTRKNQTNVLINTFLTLPFSPNPIKHNSSNNKKWHPSPPTSASSPYTAPTSAAPSPPPASPPKPSPLTTKPPSTSGAPNLHHPKTPKNPLSSSSTASAQTPSGNGASKLASSPATSPSMSPASSSSATPPQSRRKGRRLFRPLRWGG